MSDVLLDFGSGTGTFAIHAAKRFKRVHAIDVSQVMIENAKAKAVKIGVTNIMFHHAGFLTYEHKDTPADAIVTTFAFHHLPDYWKGIALKRMNSMLKPGGFLYIHDVILEEANSINNIQALIDKLAKDGGEQLRKDTERHFREEYSTYDWVMDELLARSGFQVKSKLIEGGVLGTYLCNKK
jgi:ubiquinone/menaquinone biosynthesis C-methylase UbiE